jgi:hypothetical protein
MLSMQSQAFLKLSIKENLFSIFAREIPTEIATIVSLPSQQFLKGTSSGFLYV